jgi:hypothetical protein
MLADSIRFYLLVSSIALDDVNSCTWLRNGMLIWGSELLNGFFVHRFEHLVFMLVSPDEKVHPLGEEDIVPIVVGGWSPNFSWIL